MTGLSHHQQFFSQRVVNVQKFESFNYYTLRTSAFIIFILSVQVLSPYLALPVT